MSQRPFSWMNPKLEIRATDKYGSGGKGVYALEDIEKDAVLFVMGGYILSIEDENTLRGVVADKPIELSPNFSIGPLRPSDLDRMPQHWVNHSCDPNSDSMAKFSWWQCAQFRSTKKSFTTTAW